MSSFDAILKLRRCLFASLDQLKYKIVVLVRIFRVKLLPTTSTNLTIEAVLFDAQRHTGWLELGTTKT